MNAMHDSVTVYPHSVAKPRHRAPFRAEVAGQDVLVQPFLVYYNPDAEEFEQVFECTAGPSTWRVTAHPDVTTGQLLALIASAVVQ